MIRFVHMLSYIEIFGKIWMWNLKPYKSSIQFHFVWISIHIIMITSNAHSLLPIDLNRSQCYFFHNTHFNFNFRDGSNYVRVFQRHNNRILHHFNCMDCWSIWCHLLYHTNHQATLVKVISFKFIPNPNRHRHFVTLSESFYHFGNSMAGFEKRIKT